MVGRRGRGREGGREGVCDGDGGAEFGGEESLFADLSAVESGEVGAEALWGGDGGFQRRTLNVQRPTSKWLAQARESPERWGVGGQRAPGGARLWARGVFPM